MRQVNVFPRPISLTWFFLPALALIVVTSVAGCGKRGRELAPVTGNVTYRGKPVPFGYVMFQPESGQGALGVIQSDGGFRMVTNGEGDGAAVGKNRVRIACYEIQDPAKKKLAGGGEVPLGKSLIPARYSSLDTSGIVVDVHSGANEPVVLNLVDATF